MSPHLHAEIAFAHHREIAARTTHAHHVVDLPARAGRARRPVTSRIACRVAALGTCVAITTGIAVSGALASETQASSARPSAHQLERQIAVLQSQGFVQISCTTDGTLLRNPRTGKMRSVKW